MTSDVRIDIELIYEAGYKAGFADGQADEDGFDEATFDAGFEAGLSEAGIEPVDYSADDEEQPLGCYIDDDGEPVIEVRTFRKPEAPAAAATEWQPEGRKYSLDERKAQANRLAEATDPVMADLHRRMLNHMCLNLTAEEMGVA